MRLPNFYLPLLFILLPFFLFSQTPKDKVVPFRATIQYDPPQVKLDWESPTATSDIQLFRREKGATVWYSLVSAAGTPLLTFTDTLVELGKTYEYGIQRYPNTGYTWLAYAYLSVALEDTVPDSRGTILIFVETALQQPLSTDLSTLETDLVGDGWKVIWHPVQPEDDVASVKSQIVADYNASPDEVKAVFLLGEIPVPYSGNTNWDGHEDHQGAWPADTYYGDVDFEWLDESVNNTTPAREANVNVPGDGKFDHSITPSRTELAVGRVDFSNLSETTFGASRVELYRRYLSKNHLWRTGQYLAKKRAIVDDNFGYFQGEAFAANGYRNGNAIVGESNVADGKFIQETESDTFLLAYGCGPGGYTVAQGVAKSNQFAERKVNAVFTMIFGSYHGDWDYELDPLLPAALASRGGIVSISWAGRPHWFYQHLATGETLGFCTLETQNACENPGYFTSVGECGTHASLLGDPTLRAQVVTPASDLAAFPSCNSLELVWDASPQTDLLGYHVYRSIGFNGDYVRLTSEPVNNISFVDTAPPDGYLSYQVRAVALEETPGGRFYNTSTGVFTSYDFKAIPPLNIEIAGENISCANPEVQLTSSSNAEAPLRVWVGPDGFEAYSEQVAVSVPGEYTLFVTDLATGCTASESFIVESYDEPPADVSAELVSINCSDQTAQLAGQSSSPGVLYAWSGPNGFTSNLQNPTVTEMGFYALTATDSVSGCVAMAEYSLTANLSAPTALATGGTLTCSATSVQLQGAADVEEATYQWTGPGNFSSNEQNPEVSLPGFYTLIVTDTTNSCTGALTIEVMLSGDLPVAAPQDAVITCAQPVLNLTANPDQSGYDFQWTGPDNFSSNEENPLVEAAGIYNLTVVNQQTGCSASFSAQVIADTVAPVIPPVEFHLNCLTPSITLECPILAPEILCSWSDAEGNPIPTGAAISQAGAYILTLANMTNGCSSASEVFISADFEIPELSLSGELSLDCADQTTVLTVESATPDVEVSWVGENFPDVFHPVVDPGTYTIVVTDVSSGCTYSEEITVAAPPQLEASVEVVTGCYGSPDFNLSISGGTPPYSYALSPQPPFPSGTSVDISVADALGCTFEIEQVLVEFPSVLTIAIAAEDETVAGANDGIATVQVSGGAPPYQYLWSNGQDGNPAANLAPGDYTVTVTDANGCTEIGSVAVLAGPSATAEIPGLRSIVLAPNPTGGLFDLKLSLENTQAVEAQLTDVSGRILQKIKAENIHESTWQFDLSGHPSGIYFCKIKINGRTLVRKVVKME